MWKDRSAFEFVLNQENLWEFLCGMSFGDLSVGPSVFGDVSFEEGLERWGYARAVGVVPLRLVLLYLYICLCVCVWGCVYPTLRAEK